MRKNSRQLAAVRYTLAPPSEVTSRLAQRNIDCARAHRGLDGDIDQSSSLAFDFLSFFRCSSRLDRSQCLSLARSALCCAALGHRTLSVKYLVRIERKHEHTPRSSSGRSLTLILVRNNDFIRVDRNVADDLSGTIGHVDHGKVGDLPPDAPIVMLTLFRQLLQLQSRKGKQRKALLASSTTARSTKHLKNESEVLRSHRPILSMRRIRGTILTSTVPATPITSRT